ncbi:AMP-binding protein [Xanthocytophaga flava]|uniref:AMP-binding protein n=1 Tax=Xanthocytophaga flava TaxID=3048013 RepID=UPI0028D72070|nr:AMP-binding protein [Xanthocytophaga flavus]MDJ1473204.1 AMP-binding protein [Xanthocytophaga flavus]
MGSVTFYQSKVTVSFEEIRSGSLSEKLTEYESIAWQFCYDWLTGRKTFTIHTSGSTGIPKAIELDRKQMAASALMTGNTLKLQSGYTALINLNVQYIAGMMMLVRGLVLDLHLTILEPSSLPVADLPVESRFDFQSYVPLQIQTILEKASEKVAILNIAKAIIIGGAPVSSLLEDMLQHLSAPVYQTYGMTETVSHIALRGLNGSTHHDYYTALTGVTFETDNRNCLIIHVPSLNNDPIITNDVVELVSDTAFRWKGRYDNVINSGGVKIQAEHVEQVMQDILTDMQLHQRFFIKGMPHPKLGEYVALFLEIEDLSPESKELILQKAKSLLSRYEVPKQIFCVNQFAQTPTAKVDRQKTVLPFL